ncbi:hypothetical protein QTI05_22785 [Variovorax sp. J22R193]|uniref:hypothetical protein n=1 Tax=Variovorax fucosicus TaxID=3053517 RepID=UPI002577ECD9|nr:hypothetical protein [Variovorax sp. J22R193]MDM0041885.1 hypothetical protein [Variovorax sp. J22R193]
MTQQEEIVAAARSALGKRWAHQARGEDGKTDCAGLVLTVAKEIGFLDWDIPSDYARTAASHEMLEVCRQHFIEIQRPDLRPGDIVVLRYPDTNHIGVIGDYPPAPKSHVSIIHATAFYPRCVVENRFDDMWMKMAGARLTGCFRFPERVA